MINTCQDRTDSRFWAGAHTLVFHHPVGQAMRKHEHPAWKIVIPGGGNITWTRAHGPAGHAAGVILPPHVAHSARSDADYTSVLIDPWYLGLGPGDGRPIPLDTNAVERLRTLWSPDDERDPDDRARETVAFLRQWDLLPRPVSIDPRVAAALRHLTATDCIPHVAATVGLSPSRLRALVHHQTGTPPARLRMWQRLRAAIVSLPVKPIALAAFDAGFADQAHLTRTATRLVGQTPGDLTRTLGGVPKRRRGDRTATLTTAA